MVMFRLFQISQIYGHAPRGGGHLRGWQPQQSAKVAQLRAGAAGADQVGMATKWIHWARKMHENHHINGGYNVKLLYWKI